jgi:hypothetical protein
MSMNMSTALLEVLLVQATCIDIMNFTMLRFVDTELSCRILRTLHHAE